MGVRDDGEGHRNARVDVESAFRAEEALGCGNEERWHDTSLPETPHGSLTGLAGVASPDLPMSDGFMLRSAFEDLCVESGWPVARLTFFGVDERVTLWSVAPGLEALRDSWEAAGQLSSFSARVASLGRPMLHANDMDLADFGDAACEEGLHWTVSFPLFVDAEVVGAIEACAPNRPRVDGLLRSGRLLGSLLVSAQRAA